MGYIYNNFDWWATQKSKFSQKGKDDDETKKNAIFLLCLDVDPGVGVRYNENWKKIELPCWDLRK